MVRHKQFFLALTALLFMAGASHAQTWDFNLSAGGSSLTGGLHYRTYMDTGYLRFGGSGVWTDEDSKEFKWGSADFMVGSDTLMPGLSIELGLRGLLGSAEEGIYSGDIGAVGFSGMAHYLFSRDVIPIPLEVFGGLTWAPELMSFRDTESYREYNIGAGVRVINNASIVVTYTNYHVEMEASPRSWDLDNDSVRIGLVMRF